MTAKSATGGKLISKLLLPMLVALGLLSSWFFFYIAGEWLLRLKSS